MRRLPAILYAALAVALGAAGAAGARTETIPVGTWVGTVGTVGTVSTVGSTGHPYRPAAKLVIGSGGVATASFSGLTGASHDAPTAKTSCSIRYRFFRQAATSSIFLQQGRTQYGSGGHVANSPCVASTTFNALRVVKFAPSRLRADFGTYSPAYANLPISLEFLEGRGYLQRSR